VPFLPKPLRALGERPAILDSGRVITYEALEGAADRVARRLRARGIRPGQVVALKGHPDPEVVAALHGIWRAGATAFPLHPRWTAAEEEKALRLMVPSLALLGRGMGLDGGGHDLLHLGPGRVDGFEPFEGDGTVGNGLFVSPAHDHPTDDDLAVHLLTSGTSGEARRVSLTFGNLRASAQGAVERLALGPEDRWAASLALAHVGGVALVSRAALAGSALVTGGGFRAAEFAEMVGEGTVTHASLVPTMLHQLLEVWAERPAPESLKCLLIGGARAEEALVGRAVALGFPLALTYGLTQAASQVATAPPELVRSKPGTAGPPLPGVEVRIAFDGEILVRGGTVAPGERGEGGWLRTGDLGRLDEDGHLWVVGRLSPRIISGGVNVDPMEVEGFLRKCPGVGDAAVVGLPDPEWGERVVAVLVLDDPAEPPPHLEDWIRTALSAPKRPKEVRFVAALPRNANGKVDRSRVRALFGPEGQE